MKAERLKALQRHVKEYAKEQLKFADASVEGPDYENDASVHLFVSIQTDEKKSLERRFRYDATTEESALQQGIENDIKKALQQLSKEIGI